jgi:transcription elongation factor/antiterminator RfaH
MPSVPKAALQLDERWFVVHTLPSAEMRAQENIENQDFRTFLPKKSKTVRHARRLLTTAAAFFPRYLFVTIDITHQHWRCINSSFGVARLIMRGDEPHPVPHGIVEGLIGMCDEDGIFHHGLPLKPGDPIRMIAGPFAEQLGVLDQLDDSGRVRVLLDLLGRQVSISTQASHVLPLRQVHLY